MVLGILEVSCSPKHERISENEHAGSTFAYIEQVRSMGDIHITRFQGGDSALSTASRLPALASSIDGQQALILSSTTTISDGSTFLTHNWPCILDETHSQSTKQFLTMASRVAHALLCRMFFDFGHRWDLSHESWRPKMPGTARARADFTIDRMDPKQVKAGGIAFCDAKKECWGITESKGPQIYFRTLGKDAGPT